MSGRAAQSRRLAFLAVLSLGREAGWTREALVEFFWPDQDEDRARHNLADMIYVLRQELGDGAILSRGNQVLLDPTVVACDVADFEAHVESGRAKEALSVYRGDLMEGFHVHGVSAACEHHIDAERRRLRERYLQVLEGFAEDASMRGDRRSAVARWKELVAEEPYRTRYVVELVAALAERGDPAGALRAADRHRRLLDEELGLQPPPELLDAVARVRGRSDSAAALPGDAVRSASSLSEDADDGEVPPHYQGHQSTEPVPQSSALARYVPPLFARLLIVTGMLGAVLWLVAGQDVEPVSPVGEAEKLAPPARIGSLAVLPFENLSPDPEQRYLAEVMHDALIAELGQIGALTIRSRTSVMQYQHASRSMPEIARELDVDGLIEGSLLTDGDVVRVNLHLYHGPTEQRVWSRSYEHALRNVLALQKRLARDIAEEIQVTISPEEVTRLTRVRPVDPEALTLYLKGSHALGEGTEAAFHDARQYFSRAIDIDSSYAAPYAGLAMAYIELGSWMASLEPGVVHVPARRAALHALELDSTLAEAHIALGRIEHLFEWDWAAAEASFRRGIALNPSAAHALHSYLNYLISMGRFGEAVAVGKRLAELDPLSPTAHTTLGWALEHLGHKEEALRRYEHAVDLPPHPWHPWVQLAEFHLKEGSDQVAYGYIARADEATGGDGSPTLMALLGRLYAEAGHGREAQRILEELEERAEGQYVPPGPMATLHLGLGHEEEALTLIERAYEVRDVTSVWNNVRWLWDPLRDEPRFQALLDRMSFPETP